LADLNFVGGCEYKRRGRTNTSWHDVIDDVKNFVQYREDAEMAREKAMELYSPGKWLLR